MGSSAKKYPPTKPITFTSFAHGSAAVSSQSLFDYSHAALSRGAVGEFKRVFSDSKWSEDELGQFLALAVDKDETPLQSWLIERNANPSIALHYVRKDFGAIKLIAQKADVNHMHMERSVLQDAMQYDRSDVIGVLLEEKLEVDTQALQAMIEKRFYGFVKPMLARGAKLDEQWIASLSKQISSQEWKSDIAAVLTHALRATGKMIPAMEMAICQLRPASASNVSSEVSYDLKDVHVHLLTKNLAYLNNALWAKEQKQGGALAVKVVAPAAAKKLG